MLIVFISMLPVFELRAAIPFAILSLGEPPLRVFWLSVLGNILPVIPLLIIFSRLERWLERTKYKPASWVRISLNLLFEHAKKRTRGIEKLESIGLAIFVAIPLPGTGAWTGCIVAALLKFRFLYSFVSISAGVLGAGIIVTWLTMIGRLAVSALLVR